MIGLCFDPIEFRNKLCLLINSNGLEAGFFQIAITTLSTLYSLRPKSTFL